MVESRRKNLPPEIQAALAGVRRRIRWYVWVQGLAALTIACGVAFWLLLALDWSLEPSRELRIAALGVASVGLLIVLYRKLLTRGFRRLGDSSMAILLERNRADLRDSLLTTVELADVAAASEHSREMLDHTRRQASQLVPNIPVGDIFNPAPLLRYLVVAALLAGSVTLFGFGARESFAFFVGRRLIALEDQPWPRQTRLLVDGFAPDADGVRRVKIARGGELPLRVLADNDPEHVVPERVEVRQYLDDGGYVRAPMSRIGNALPGRDPFQEFRHVFQDIYVSRMFHVRGGDDEVRHLHIEVVDPPAIVEMHLACDFPKYLGRSPRTLPVAGAMRITEGTRITLEATANKDLVQVRIIDPAEGEPALVEIPADAEDRRRFSFALPPLHKDRVLFLQLIDADGITTAEEDRYRLALEVLTDEPPQVKVALDGIGTAITNRARVPFTGEVLDDYAIDRLWFAHQTAQPDSAAGPVITAPLEADTGVQQITVAEALDVEALGLSPGQQFSVAIRAADRYDLGEAPNESGSPRFVLDVVTPDQLRRILEGDELRLRRRFEDLIRDVRDNRKRIAVLLDDVAEPAGEQQSGATQGDGNPSEDAQTGDSAESGSPADKEGEAAAPEEANRVDEDLLRQRRLQLTKAEHYAERAGHDVLSVAESFEQIRKELVNNRLDTEELKERLSEGIARPLREIGGPMAEELRLSLQQVEAHLADSQRFAGSVETALADVDRMLIAMEEVLNRMLELESYNEVMDKLRNIIAELDQISVETQQRRRSDLKKRLLGEDEENGLGDEP